MARLPAVVVWCLGAWLALAAGRSAAAELTFHHENVMGTALELRVRADSAPAARWAEGRVLAEIDRQSAIFSGYDPASELRRWQAAPEGPTRVSPELFELLEASDRWRALSRGAFDPRVQALSQLWARCAQADRLPTADELADARALMSPPAWRLDPAARTATRLSGCPLTLNAIAKGYIIERACQAALEPARGVRGLLLNVGGDLRVCGEMTRTVGIANPWADSETTEPVAFVAVRDRAMATSGRSQRGFTIQGKHYSHILDPRTGTPADRVASATVIAERSADADALATICNVLEPEQSLRLASSLPGVVCLILTADGRTLASPGWERFAAAPNAAGPQPARAGRELQEPKPAGAQGDGGWGNAFELAINFEINRPPDAGGRYRRPYVVVWVEDSKGHQVRTLVLWLSVGGSGPYQWLPDLKRWYATEQSRSKDDKTDLLGTVSRPTRPPGKYRAIWDGKDNDGKPVPAGAYIINIEAAREHGTYQAIRQPVNLGATPFAEELKGNVEVKSASLEYRRKAPAR